MLKPKSLRIVGASDFTLTLRERIFFHQLFLSTSQLWQENRPDYVNIQLYLSQTDGVQVCG